MNTAQINKFCFFPLLLICFCQFNLHSLFPEHKRVEEKVTFSSSAGMKGWRSYILIWVVVKPAYTYVDIHQALHLRFMHFTVCTLYNLKKSKDRLTGHPFPSDHTMISCRLALCEGTFSYPLLWVCQRPWLWHLTIGLCRVPILQERKMRRKERIPHSGYEDKFLLTARLN